MLDSIPENSEVVFIDIPVLEEEHDSSQQCNLMAVAIMTTLFAFFVAILIASSYPLLSAYLIFIGVILIILAYAASLVKVVRYTK